jgi:hypothetical protein
LLETKRGARRTERGCSVSTSATAISNKAFREDLSSSCPALRVFAERDAVAARELGKKSIGAIVRRATAGAPRTIPLKDVRLK